MSLLESLIYANVLSEALHSEIKDVLESEYTPREKYSLVTKKIRTLINNGEDTGLENDKPKKGSSRAVYFPKDMKEVSIDGIKTKMPTVVKIAFHGKLDKYRDRGEPLLGELQNNVESDGWKSQQYAVLHHHGDGTATYDENGILAPVVDSASDDSWLEMGRIHPITASKFKELTTNEKFPKGITFKQFHNNLINEHNLSHGRGRHIEDVVSDHPLVEQFKSYMFDTGTNPNDFVASNMGIWKHPVTGKEHIVASDYGFDADTEKEYGKAYKNQVKAFRGY